MDLRVMIGVVSADKVNGRVQSICRICLIDIVDMLGWNSMTFIAVTVIFNFIIRRSNGNKSFSIEFWIVDNGHTIQVTLEANPTSLAEVSGYEFDYPYIFAQIHFHWGYDDETGSEHSIDNEFYPMEAHLVHYDSKYANFTAAANSGDPKGLAVIAVFITEGHDRNYHTGFDTIAENIPQ